MEEISELQRLESYEKMVCKKHGGKPITHICCYKDCHKSLLCNKCLIYDLDHYTSHKADKNFKEISELKGIIEEVEDHKDVDKVVKELAKCMDEVPGEVARIVGEVISNKFKDVIEEKMKPFIMESVIAISKDELKSYFEAHDTSHPASLGHTLLEMKNRDTYHTTRRNLDIINFAGYDNWIKHNLIKGLDVGAIADKVVRVASSSLRKVMNLKKKENREVFMLSRYKTNCDLYNYTGKNGVALTVSGSIEICSFFHYAVKPQDNQTEALTTFYIIPGREFKPDESIHTSIIDLNMVKLSDSTKDSEIMKTQGHLKAPERMICYDLETPALLQKDTMYSFWYVYPNNKARQYWGDNGVQVTKGPKDHPDLNFKFTRVTSGDSGNNNYKWGVFASFLYSILDD